MGQLQNTDNWNSLKEQIMFSVKSGLLPDSIKTPEQAFVIAKKGEELGLPMMQAFSSINVIKGKPTLSAELMLGMVYNKMPKAKIFFAELNQDVCTIHANRDGGKEHTVISFSMDDADRAGITKRYDYKKAEWVPQESWQKYPTDMLRSRAISRMCRTLFPDVIMGCYTPEEMESARDVSPALPEPKTEETPKTASSKEDTLNKLIQAFMTLNISKDDILRTFDLPDIESLSDENIKDLREAYGNIKNGNKAANEFFVLQEGE